MIQRLAFFSLAVRILLGFVLVLMGHPIFATDISSEEHNDELLQTLEARSQSISQLEGEFEQLKLLSALPKPIKSSGHFHFHRSTGIVWHTEQPISSKIEISRLGIFAEGEVIGNRYSDVIASIFMALISGQLNDLEKYFDLVAHGKSEQWQLILTPKYSALAREITQIEISGRQLTERIILHDGSGGRTNIHLKKVSAQYRLDSNSNRNRHAR